MEHHLPINNVEDKLVCIYDICVCINITMTCTAGLETFQSLKHFWMVQYCLLKLINGSHQ